MEIANFGSCHSKMDIRLLYNITSTKTSIRWFRHTIWPINCYITVWSKPYRRVWCIHICWYNIKLDELNNLRFWEPYRGSGTVICQGAGNQYLNVHTCVTTWQNIVGLPFFQEGELIYLIIKLGKMQSIIIVSLLVGVFMHEIFVWMSE